MTTSCSQQYLLFFPGMRVQPVRTRWEECLKDLTTLYLAEHICLYTIIVKTNTNTNTKTYRLSPLDLHSTIAHKEFVAAFNLTEMFFPRPSKLILEDVLRRQYCLGNAVITVRYREAVTKTLQSLVPSFERIMITI